MANDTAIHSSTVNDLDNSFVTIRVTGLRQNKNLRRGYCTFKVSHSNMSETMRRINRMGAKIVDVTFSSQYESHREELETHFVGTDLAINFYLDQAYKYEEKVEAPVISTPTETAIIEQIEVQNTEVETEIEVETEGKTEVTEITQESTEILENTTNIEESTEDIDPSCAGELISNEIAQKTQDQSEVKTSDHHGKKTAIHKHKKGWKSKRK